MYDLVGCMTATIAVGGDVSVTVVTIFLLA
jgi:hypothetical protein